MAYLGIDIGGTKTLMILFDLRGNILFRQKILTAHLYQNFLNDLKLCLSQINDQKIELCAVAIPGLIDKDKKKAIAFGNLDWKNIPIREDIEEIVQCGVLIEHDVSLGGLYEARQLKTKKEKVLYLTISTGIGAGLIINDRIEQNLANSEPGQMEILHNRKMVTWESFASGKAIKKEFGKEAKDIKDRHSWKVIAENISQGLLDVIAIFQPDVIIFGGSVSHYFNNFEDPLKEALHRYDNPMIKIPILKKAHDPDNSVIYGCLELIKDNLK